MRVVNKRVKGKMIAYARITARRGHQLGQMLRGSDL